MPFCVTRFMRVEFDIFHVIKNPIVVQLKGAIHNFLNSCRDD